MGLIHSRASKKRDEAEAKLLKAQLKVVKDEQRAAKPSLSERLVTATARMDESTARRNERTAQAKLEPGQLVDILAAFEAGEMVPSDLTREQWAQIPFSLSIKCRRAATQYKRASS